MPSDDLEVQRWEQHRREHDTFEEYHRREHDTEKEARNLAASNITLRLDRLNELRDEVLEDRTLFVRRDTHSADLGALRVQHDADHTEAMSGIQALKERADRAEGAQGTWRFIAMFVGLPGLIAFLYAIAQMFGVP